MSHPRKNSVRDRVGGRKWIYSDQRETHSAGRCGPSQRASVATKYGVVSFHRLGNLIH